MVAQSAWWIRVDNGPHLQTARDRRRVWRAATRAAQEVRETGKGAGREREKRETGSNRKQQQAIRCTSYSTYPNSNKHDRRSSNEQQQCDYNDAHDVRRNVDFIDGVNV